MTVRIPTVLVSNRASATVSLGVLLVASSFGCHRFEAAAPTTAQDPQTALSSFSAARIPVPQKRENLPLIWTRLPLLPPGLQPEGWAEATQAWATATTAFGLSQLDEASEFFLRAAAALRNNTGRNPAARVSTTGRCLAYENAGRALRAAGKSLEARVVLENAGESDPACKHSVALRISHITRSANAPSPIRRAGP